MLAFKKPRIGPSKLRSFRSDERGQVMILFALLIIPMLGLAATAIDMGRAHHARQVLQSAVDAAAMAGAQRLGQPREEVGETIAAFLKANLPPRLSKKLIHEVVISDHEENVTVRMNDHIDATLARIIGFKGFDIKAEATFNRPKPLIAIAPDDIDDRSLNSKPAISPASKPEPPKPADLRSALSQIQVRDAQVLARRMLERAMREGRESEIKEIIRALGRL